MTRALDEAYDKWRGVPACPERPVGTLLSDRELSLTKQAFEGGVRAALEVASRFAADYETDGESAWAYAAEMVRDEIRVSILGMTAVDPSFAG